MNKPITAYKGSEPFVFVCYSHTDADKVYPDMRELADNGINLWYDEGISAGSSWRAEIAAAISNAKQFIFFISNTSIKSSHCLREVDYALNHDIEIIPVYLEECRLPAELDLVLNRVQALFKNEDSMYMQHLLAALREKRGLSVLLPISNKKKSGWWLPALLTGLAFLLLGIWQPWDKFRYSESTGVSTIPAPGAYDRYLDGLKLMERWDKDDNLETAIGLFQQATEIDPDFALAYARLAGALRLRYVITKVDAWLDDAIENANKAVDLNPGLAPVQVTLGRVHATLGNFDLAFAALELALSIDPNDAEANQAIATVYERQGRLSDAESSFQKAMALDQENILIRDSYANFLFRQSRFDEAATNWSAVVRLAPDHFSALVNLGSALSEIGRIPESITMYERAIEIRPTYMAYSNLGVAYSRLKRYPEALEATRKALEIDASDWLAWGNLAYIYSWMNGMDSKAVETFEQAIQRAEAAREQNPRDSFVHSDLALYYAKTGQQEMALQRLETAVALSPGSGEILAAAAEAYEIIGQRDMAIKLVQKSLELGYPVEGIRINPELVELLTDPRMQSLP